MLLSYWAPLCLCICMFHSIIKTAQWDVCHRHSPLQVSSWAQSLNALSKATVSDAQKKHLCVYYLRGILPTEKGKRKDWQFPTFEGLKEWSVCERRKVKTRFILTSCYKIMKYLEHQAISHLSNWDCPGEEGCLHSRIRLGCCLASLLKLLKTKHRAPVFWRFWSKVGNYKAELTDSAALTPSVIHSKSWFNHPK